MATYNLFELLTQTSILINEGHSYADISVLSSDENFVETLQFDIGFDGDSFSSVELSSIPNADIFSNATINQDTPFLTLSLKETLLLKDALECSLIYNKECLKEPKLSHSDIDNIKTFSAQTRNLLVKVEKLLKKLD